MHTFRRFFPAALVAVALILPGCTGGSPTSRRALSVLTVGTGAGFEPTELTVDKDDNVRITVRNATTGTHGFSIEGYGVRREVPGNETLEVRFKSTKPGTFKIFCQLHETHKLATLVVQ